MNRILTSVAFVAAAVVIFGTQAQATTIWDTATDLQASGAIVTTNPTGAWTLGQANQVGGVGYTFAALPNHSDSFNNSGTGAWYGNEDLDATGYDYGLPQAMIIGGHLQVHPGYDNGSSPYYAVVRWTAPSSGTYNISALMTDVASGPSSSDEYGVDVHLLYNGTSIFDAKISSEDDAYSTSASGEQQAALQAGDTLDFVVGPNGSHWSDMTQIDTTIMMIPEPSTIILMVTGILGLLAYAWRKQK